MTRHLIDTGSTPTSTETLTRLKFAGSYVAGLLTKVDLASDYEELDVVSYDLAGHRASTGNLLGVSTDAYKPRLVTLALSSSGRLAWLEEAPAHNGLRAGIRAAELTHGSPTQRHLDYGAPGTISHLALSGSHLSWRHNGKTRSATLTIAAPTI